MPNICSRFSIPPHAPRHQNGGNDEISLAGLSGQLADEQLSSWALVSGKPSTFTPAAHASAHQNSGSDEINVAGLSGVLADLQDPIVASVRAAMAFGAADLKLFMNAAGDAVEFAPGLKIIVTTHDISVAGAQAITGVGFKPNIVICFAVVNSTYLYSWGIDDGTTARGIMSQSTDAAGRCAGTSNLIALYTSGSTNTYALITSRDADGITITWTKTGSPTGTAQIFLLFLR
jgi:hypothetical protein